MPAAIGVEEVNIKIHKFNPNISVITGFLGVVKKCELHCSTCGYTWQGMPRTYYQERRNGNPVSGCPNCKNIETGKRSRYSESMFKEKLYHKHKGTIALLTNYVNSHTKEKFKCSVCGNIWEAAPASVLSRNGCPVCAIRIRGENSRTTEEEVKEMLAKEGKFSLVKYGGTLNSKDSIVQCNNCHSEKTGSIYNAIRLTWCPVCCNSNSQGNDDIFAILSYNKVKFSREHAFRNPFRHNHIQRFDFYLPSVNTALEYQGVQHYDKGNNWHTERNETADRDKKNYCIKKGIKLVYLYSLETLCSDLEQHLGIVLKEPPLSYKRSLYPNLGKIIDDLRSGLRYEDVEKKYSVGNKLVDRYVKLAGYKTVYELRNEALVEKTGLTNENIINWLRTGVLKHSEKELGVTSKYITYHVFYNPDISFNSISDIREDTIKSKAFKEYRKNHSKRDTCKYFHTDPITVDPIPGKGNW